jgi:hypothetical protein
MVNPRRIPPQWWYKNGTKIITVDLERFMPEAKSTNYITAIYALKRAKKWQRLESCMFTAITASLDALLRTFSSKRANW